MRIPLLLGLLFVSALVNPSLRAAAEPYARPYLKWALDPVFEWGVQVRVKEIARTLEEYASGGNPMPTPAEFPAFLQRFYRTDTSHLDPWDTPFWLRPDAQYLRVISAGRDRTFGTPDDVISPAIRAR